MNQRLGLLLLSFVLMGLDYGSGTPTVWGPPPVVEEGGGITLTGCELVDDESGGTSHDYTTGTLDISDGDLMVAFVGGDPSCTDIGIAGTWVEVVAFDDFQGQPCGGLWYREADSEGEDPTYTVSWTGSQKSTGGICKITGHDSGDILDNHSANSGSGTAQTSLSIAVDTGALAMYIDLADGYTTDVLTCPSGFVEDDDCWILVGSSSGNVAVGVAWEIPDNPTGDQEWTLEPEDGYRAFAVSFNAE